MSDAGYTLTETLAALAVLGMAMGGLALGAQVIGSQQLSGSKAVRQLQSLRSGQEALEARLALGAPFGSQSPDQLSGDAGGFHFACGAAALCAAQVVTSPQGSELTIGSGDSPTHQLSMMLAAPAHFVYRGAKGSSEVWPPAEAARQTLRSVALVQTTDQGDVALIEAKVWAEQRAQCDFDPVMQDCR